MVVSLISILLFGAVSSGATTSIAGFAGDADAALNTGDAFHAYRSYAYIEEFKPKSFAKLALGGYIQSVFLLAPQSQIKQECDRLTTTGDKARIFKAAYICGLEYTQIKKAVLAATYLSKINRSSNFFWPAQILLATDDLVEDSPEKVLTRLDPKDLSQYKKFDLDNVFQLSLARGLIALNKFEDALIHYQTVGSSSPMYVNALEETACAFFKMKRFESAQVLIDVLKTNYEAAFRGAQKIKVPAVSYYEARYLEAYIELAEQRTDNALSAFSQLQADYEKFIGEAKADIDPNSIIQAVKESSDKWADSRNFPDILINELQLIDAWVSPDMKLKIERDIALYAAYSHEASRTNAYADEFKSDLASYPRDIKKLKDLTLAAFGKDISDALKKTSQSLNAFTLKTRLGRLEVTSMARAQGARSLDDVIDDYLARVHQMNELAPP